MSLIIEKRSKKYKYICNVCNTYSLLLFLLSFNKKEVEETFFIFNASISREIRSKFTHSYTMPNYNNWGICGKLCIILFGFLIFRYIRIFKLPSFNSSILYSSDFSRYDSLLIAKENYYNIEDCPKGYFQTYQDFYASIEAKKRKCKIKYWLVSILYGKIYYHRFGNNPQCVGFLTATEQLLSYQKNKKIKLISFKDIWSQSSENKKNLILNIFNITPDDIKCFKEKDFLLLTQPLWPDFISKESHYEVYRKILSNYDPTKVLIKTHPRDIYNYQELSKDVQVISKNFPFQLITLMGIQYKRIATVFSTAVCDIDRSNTKIDWYGTEIDPTLHSILGDINEPVS